MIHEQSYELVQRNVRRRYSIVCKLTILDFVNHVLYLLFCWVITHSSLQVWKLIDWYLFVVQLSCLCGVLFFGSDNTIVEKVIHVLESLTFSSSLYKVYEGLNAFAPYCDCLFDRSYINCPHIDSKVVPAAGEDVFTIGCATNISNFVWMGNQSHRFVGVSIKWELYQPNYLFVCAVN